MMKDDAEKAIRQLVHIWAKEVKNSSSDGEPQSFIAFSAWIEYQGYAHYTQFRSRLSPRYQVELWFDDELGLTSQR